MVDLIITGDAGKLHAVYHKSAVPSAPLAVILSGNPRQKHHMNDRVSYAMFRAFMDIGFSVVRFNYRGVGDSEGVIGTTSDNMLDIATVIDWIQNNNEDSEKIWLAGHQLGAWYVLQAMMRRPEISGFALVSPDTAVSDFAFLSPRPNRGLLLQGACEGDDARAFADHLTQVLKKQAQIDLETIRVKNSDAGYSQPADLRQMYNDLKAYVGREKEEAKLL
ncbi:MAG: alpha/beta fold hydrolase [Alphaproteobacteria bacterium]|nr:alpha/beta fold hydrolase [Alphaproteobacteria bacterium]MBR5575223.1 alpha/beta fold hydrolase [Alphaproteobacteria bacterium]